MTTVLIVDDSRAARMMLKHWIKALRPDYLVKEAGNADEALNQVAELGTNPIIMLDYNMPGKNGIELAQELVPTIAPQRIALCTANIQEAVRAKAEKLGLGYVAKPLNPKKVKALFETLEPAA